jgi:aminoglycoside phosphotransferase (APT) family kinase protein
LLTAQHPDLANLPIHLVDAGWDNAMFRLGDRHVVRLPRRQVAATLIEHEQTWLPQIAKHLSIPVPTPERLGSQKARWSAIAEYGVSEATLQRAKGWAVVFGVILLDTGLVDHPRHAVMGERTLRRVAEDA